MANACLRCGRGVDTGETFCQECRRRDDATVEVPDSLGETRAWILLVVAPLVAFGGSRVVAFPWSLLVYGVCGVVFGVTLYYDAAHVRKLDAEWSPSRPVYVVLALLSVSVFWAVAPVVAPYHLYRRRRAVGLPT